jgi:hypothetical protein
MLTWLTKNQEYRKKQKMRTARAATTSASKIIIARRSNPGQSLKRDTSRDLMENLAIK